MSIFGLPTSFACFFSQNERSNTKNKLQSILYFREEVGKRLLRIFSGMASTSTASASRTTKTAALKDLVSKQDRFGIFKLLFEYTKPDRRICDVQGFGPANVNAFSITTKQWDEIVNSRVLRDRETGSDQCNGAIFHSFRRKHFYRRCDAAAKGILCTACEKMQNSFVNGKIRLQCEDYVIDKTAVMKRSAVTESMEFWISEASRLKELHKLDKKFPFLKAKTAVHMIFYDSYLLFANAKSRSYQRSAWLVQRQNRFLRECLTLML